MIFVLDAITIGLTFHAGYVMQEDSTKALVCLVVSGFSLAVKNVMVRK